MELILPTKISVKPSDIHGLGVFANEKISKGEVIEETALLELPIQKGERSTLLMNHRYVWPKGAEWYCHVVALGCGSLYNHSNTPNADWNNNLENNSFLFTALEDIEPGEEIFVYYGDETFWADGRSNIEIK